MTPDNIRLNEANEDKSPTETSRPAALFSEPPGGGGIRSTRSGSPVKKRTACSLKICCVRHS